MLPNKLANTCFDTKEHAVLVGNEAVLIEFSPGHCGDGSVSQHISATCCHRHAEFKPKAWAEWTLTT